MKIDETFEVRDARRKEMFRVDDAYLNGYARLCGMNATGVYLCLCRHSDRNQESFPSVLIMAEKLGISRDSVMRGIKKLIEWNIIAKERERREDATWLHNRYTLLDRSVWKPKPSSSQLLGHPSSKLGGSQVANEAQSQVAHSDLKDTHSKGTHKKDTHPTSVETSSTRVASPSKKKKEVVNPGSGKIYMELVQWAENRRGSPFLKQRISKQFKAFTIAQDNGITIEGMKGRWVDMERDKFWSVRGYDWMDVVNSFNRKG